MTQTNPHAAPSETQSDGAPLFSASKIIAVVVGNALEFYDFLSFTFFAVNLARVMFPVGLPGTALLLTLMTGSLGFFARPLGAVLFGLLGDRIGRRPTMLATFTLMGVGALGLALTPDYASIGIAAPILVVAFRVIQGVAAGGDVGPTTAYLAECAPLARRGLFTSLQLAAMRLGALASGLVGLGRLASAGPAGHARRFFRAGLAAQHHEKTHDHHQGDARGNEKDDQLGLRHNGLSSNGGRSLEQSPPGLNRHFPAEQGQEMRLVLSGWRDPW